MNRLIRPLPMTLILTGLMTLFDADFAGANSAIFRKTLNGTVLIVAKDSVGTGALIDQTNRLVFTCSHVTNAESDVIVYFPMFINGQLVSDINAYTAQKETQAIRGHVILQDPKRDLAVVQLERLGEGAQSISVAAGVPEPGEEVHAIGNSGIGTGLLWRYSTGTVRQSHRYRDFMGKSWIEVGVIETQIPTNSGDSGGPVLNSQGELVGLTMAVKKNESLVSLAIDIHEVHSMIVQSFLRIARTPIPAVESTITTKKPGITVTSVLTGSLWRTPIPASLNKGAGGCWMTQFRSDGTFSESVINAAGVVTLRSEGRFQVNGNELKMTSGNNLHWMGQVVIHSGSSIAFVGASGLISESAAVKTLTEVPMPKTSHSTEIPKPVIRPIVPSAAIRCQHR